MINLTPCRFKTEEFPIHFEFQTRTKFSRPFVSFGVEELPENQSRKFFFSPFKLGFSRGGPGIKAARVARAAALTNTTDTARNKRDLTDSQDSVSFI